MDTVAGSETVTIAGDLSETIEGSRSNSSSRQDFNVDGKLTVRGREETNILHGNMRETHHGPELLLCGMSDDMVGGVGIRTTAPVDLWLTGMIGLEEKLGTANADGALVEIAGMHMEREYGKGVHAYGAGVWTGAFFTHTASGFRPLMKVVRGVRNMTPGGGAGGAGAPAAAAPPAGAPPVATVPSARFMRGVAKLGTNADPVDFARFAGVGESVRDLEEVENARQIPAADLLNRVDDVVANDARPVILLDDGTGNLARHAGNGADFDDPDWLRHLGGDGTPADDAARRTNTPGNGGGFSTLDFRNSSRLRAEVDQIRADNLVPLLDPTTNADQAAQSIADKIRTLHQTAGTPQDKIRQYSLALALVEEGLNPVGVLDDVDAASDVSSMLRLATPLPPPPTFADEIRPAAVAPPNGRRQPLYADPRGGANRAARPIDETRLGPVNAQRFFIEDTGLPGIPIVKIHTSFQEALENGSIVADVRNSHGEKLDAGAYFIQFETGSHPPPVQVRLTDAELADIREGVNARARADGASAANDAARGADAPNLTPGALEIPNDPVPTPGTPEVSNDLAPTPAQVPNEPDFPQVREYLDPDDQGQDRLSRLATVERIKRDKLAAALNPNTNAGEAAQRIADRIRTLDYAADTSPETIRQYNLALALVQEGRGLHPAGVLDDLDVAADVTDIIRFSTPVGSDPAFLSEINNIRANNLVPALPDGVDADRAARMIADRLEAIEETLDTARLSPQEVFDLKLDYNRALALVEAGLDPTGIINNPGISTEVDGILRSTTPIPVEPSPVYAQVGGPRKGGWAGAEVKPADFTRRPTHNSVGARIAGAEEARLGLETTEGGLPIAYVHPETFEAVQAAGEFEDFRVILDVRDQFDRRFAEGEYVIRVDPRAEPGYKQVPLSEAEGAELTQFAINRYSPDGADNTGGEAFEPWADLIERREQADRFYQHNPETTGAKPSGLQLIGENHLQTTRIELRNMLADLVRPYADDLGLDDARLTALDTNMRGSDTALNLRQEFVRAISEARAEGQIENSRVMQSTLDNWDAFATAQIAEAIDHADELADWDGIRLADNLDQGAFIDELRRLQAEEVAKYPEDVGSIPVEEVNVINAAVTAYGRAIGNAEAGYDPVPYIVETEIWGKTFGGDGGLDNATAARVKADVRRAIAEALDNPAFKTGPDVDPPNQHAILTQAQTDAFHAGDFDRAWDLQKQIDEFDEQYRASVDSDYANPADLIAREDGRPQPSRGALAARRDPGTWPRSFDPNGADTPVAGNAPAAATQTNLFDDPIYALPPTAKPDLFDSPLYARVGLSRDAGVQRAAPTRIRAAGADEIYSRAWSEPRIPNAADGRFEVDTGLRMQVRHNFYGDMGAHRAPLTDIQRKVQRWFGTDDLEDVVDTRRGADGDISPEVGGYSTIGSESGTRADSGAVDGYIESDDYSAIDFTDDVEVDYNVTDDADYNEVFEDADDLPVVWLGGSFDDVLTASDEAKPAADGFDAPLADIYRWEAPEGGRADNRPRLDEDGASWSPDDGASGIHAPQPGEGVPPRSSNADSLYEPFGAAEPGDGPGPSQLIENSETTRPYADAEGRTGSGASIHPSDYTRETLVTTTPVRVGNSPDGLPKVTDDGIPIAYISPNVLEVLERQDTVLEVYDAAGNKLVVGDYVVRVDQSLAKAEFATPQVTITAGEANAIAEGAASRRQRALAHWASMGGLLEDASARPVEVSELTQSTPNLPGSFVADASALPPARTDWTRIPLPGENGFGELGGRLLGAGAGEADRTGLHHLDIASPAGELFPRPSALDRPSTPGQSGSHYSSLDDLDDGGYSSVGPLDLDRRSGAGIPDGGHYSSVDELDPTSAITAAIEPEAGSGRVALPFDEAGYETFPTTDVAPAREDPSIRMAGALNDVRRPFEPTDGAAVNQVLGRWMGDAVAAGGSDVRRTDAADSPHRFAEPPPLPAPRQRRPAAVDEYLDVKPFSWEELDKPGIGWHNQPTHKPRIDPGDTGQDRIRRIAEVELIKQHGRAPALPPGVDANRVAQRIVDRIDNLRHTTGTTPEKIRQYNLALSLVQEGLDPTNILTDLDAKSDMRYFFRPPAVPRAERPPRIPAIVNSPGFKQRLRDDLHTNGWVPLPDDVDTDLAVRKIADRVETIESTFDASRFPRMSNNEMKLAFDQQAEKIWQYNTALALVNSGLDPIAYEGGWTTAIAADLQDILRQSSRSRNT